MAVQGESDSNQPWSLADASAAALAASTFITACDFIKALRSSDWAPPLQSEWLGMAASAVAVFVVAAAIGVSIYGAVRMFNRGSLLTHSTHGILPAAIAVFLGTGFAVSLPFSPAYLFALLGLSVLCVVHRALAARRALANPTSVTLAWTCAAIGSVAGGWWITVTYFYWPHRDITTLVGAFLGAVVGWALLSFVAAIPRGARLRSYRPILTWGALAVGTISLLAAVCVVPRLSVRNNNTLAPVVLITSDAMRASSLSLYDGPVPTPRLIDVASQNTAVFDRSYSLAPWTLPSMFGMFASRVPDALTAGAGRDAWQEEVTLYRFPKDATTLASVLRDRGYATAGFVGNSLLRDPQGILRGFDTHAVIGHRTHSTVGPLHGMPVMEALCLRLGMPVAEERPVDTTRILTAYAESYIRNHRGQPYFLWVHFMDPHTAYAPPARFLSKNWTWPVYCNADAYWGTPLSDTNGNVALSETEQAKVKALYQGEIRYVDEAVGKIWAALVAAGTSDSTYMCFTSDHGEELWDHGGYGHGQSLFDELIRVPLVIRGPKITRKQYSAPISAIDLIPTFAGLVGVDPPAGWQGRNLAGGLTGEITLIPSPVFAQGTNAFASSGPLQSLVDGNNKLIHEVESGHYFLYDLNTDPGEGQDLLGGGEPPGPLRDKLTERAGLAPLTVRETYEEWGEDGQAEDLDAQMRGMGYIR